MQDIQLWPEWSIAREIGSGSFGKVYEIHRRNGMYLEKAALKVIRIPSSPVELEQLQMDGIPAESTEEYLARHVEEIRREISLMQRFVGYSNIVSYEDHRIYRRRQGIGWDILIRMELLTALSEQMTKRQFTERDVLQIGLDISQALVICHSAGIIHRDIKPQNIFINDRGFYKLGDFGISRALPQSGSVLSFKGTVSYMAPETFSMRNTDARSDIYSLALVLYRLLNGGREPFLSTATVFSPSERENAMHRRLRGELLPRPQNCSEKLWRVLAPALAPDPSARYQTSSQFQSALQSVSAESGVQIPRPISQDYSNRQNERSITTGGWSTLKIQLDRLLKGDESDRKKSALVAALVLTAMVLIGTSIWMLADSRRKAGTQQISIEPQTNTAEYNPSGDTEGTASVGDEQPAEENITQDTGGEDQQGQSDSFTAAGGIVQTDAGAGSEEDLSTGEVDYEDYTENFDEGGGAGGASSESVPSNMEEQEEQQEDAGKNEITFADAALEEAVRSALNIRNRPITLEDAAGKTILNLSGKGKSNDDLFSDLTGLSAFSDLKEVHMDDNRVSDLSELSQLNNLEMIYMENNQISDLQPLVNLANLNTLEVNGNNISNISPLSQCSKLEVLDIRDNSINDISAVANMTSLRQLAMSDNPFDSIDSVRNLERLWYLSFNNTDVKDLSPVSNLKKLTTLCMHGTKVRDIKILLDLPELGYLDIEDCDEINDTQTINKLKERDGMRIKQ